MTHEFIEDYAPFARGELVVAVPAKRSFHGPSQPADWMWVSEPDGPRGIDWVVPRSVLRELAGSQPAA